MKVFKVLVMSLFLLLAFSSISFAWSGWIKGFSITSVTVNQYGGVDVWGKEDTRAYDVKFNIPNSDPHLKTKLAMLLTAQSSDSKINIFSDSGHIGAVTLR